MITIILQASYENTLMYLGALLFILLCGILVYYTIKKEEIKKLLWFFPIPIIMILSPRIVQLAVNKDGLKIDLSEKIEEVVGNPNDPCSQQALAKAIDEAERKAKTPIEIKEVAEANLILGNNKKVIELTEKVLKENSNNQENENVQQLKEIKEVAVASQEIQSQQRTISDTALLHRKIDQIKWENPKTKVYLNKKVDLIGKH